MAKILKNALFTVAMLTLFGFISLNGVENKQQYAKADSLVNSLISQVKGSSLIFSMGGV